MGFYRKLAIVSLLFLGITALIGGIPLIIFPLGPPNPLPPGLLAHSPFHTFFIPGLTLLVMNGLLSFFVLWLTLRNVHGYGLWIALQGCVLLGWLIVQCIMIRAVGGLHYLYAANALALLVSGLMLNSLAHKASPIHLPA